MVRQVTWLRSLVIVLVAALVVPLVAPLEAEAQQEQEPRFRALVFSKVTNFYHESIPDGIATIEALGEAHGFEVVATDDSSVFTDESLDGFDVVVFNNTNSTPEAGDLLTSEQRDAFQRYIRSGGGWAGLHSASGSERDWEWYEGLVGTMFTNHPPPQLPDGTIPGRVKVTDRVHPSTSALDEIWQYDEEWYNFAPDPSPDVHVLAQIDTKVGISGLQMGDHHPYAWCHRYDGGRSWYTAGGHAPSVFYDEDFRGHLLGGIEWAAGVVDGDCGATVEDDFERTQLTGDLTDPMEVSVADDGRAFIIERAGAIKRWDPQTRQTDTVGQLDVAPLVHTIGANGLTLDPDFVDNGWLYVYYSPDGDDHVHRLSRLTLEGDAIAPGSEATMLEIPAQREVNGHEAGSMTWDADGNLFLATGDNTVPTLYSPIDERPGQEHADAQRSSGNTNDLRGKVLRITPTDDGGYTVPDGNLFDGADPELTRPEIYTMGHRQPYRIHHDDPTGRLLWGDVGEDANQWSDTRGPIGLDHFHVTDGPTNSGWPYCNGRYAYLQFDHATGQSGEPFDCAGGPTNTSPNNTGLEQLPPVDQAKVWYPYEWSNYADTPPWPELGNGGRLAVGGPVYRYDPDLDSDTKFPEYYDGKWFIADWLRGWIKTASIAEQDHTSTDYPDVAVGDVYSIDPWQDATEFLRPHDMEFGPEGSLYLLEWGSNYGGAGRGEPNDDAGLYRIDYVHGSRAPVAEAGASTDSGPVPLEVAFSSEGSFHPEGDPFSVAWDFGDGTTSTDDHPTHVYETAGSYEVRLTVSDDAGRQGEATVRIEAGNTRSEVTIEHPPHGGFVSPTDLIGFDLSIEDAEDGSTAEGTIDCDRVTVQPSVVIDGDPVAQATQTGCEGTYVPGSVAGQAWDDDVTYGLEASYTDEGAPGVGALTGSDEVVLQPRRKQAEHFSAASGINVVQLAGNEGSEQQLGGAVVGSISHGNWVAYDPINLEGVEALTFHGNSAGTGGFIEARAGAPDGPLVADPVEMPNTGNLWRFNFVDVTTQVRDDAPDGPFELYLRFTSPGGGNDLFNLHWFEVEGDAVGSVDAVSVTDVSADMPLTSDRGNAVAVAVENSSQDTDASVTVGLETPDGWSSTTATTSVAAAGTEVVELTVTPPPGPSFADLTVELTSDDLPTAGTSGLTVAAVPHIDDVHLALDGGTPDSPVLDGYQRLSEEDAWSPDAGYGWVDGEPESRDRDSLDDLRRDFVASSSPATLRLAVPAGPHEVALLRGDTGFTAHNMVVSEGDEPLADGSGTLAAGEFEWLTFELDGGETGREVDLQLDGTPGEFWHVGGLLLTEVSASTGAVEASLDPQDPDGQDGWYVSPVQLLLASDGDAELAWRPAGEADWIDWTEPVTFDEDGQYALEYRTAGEDHASPDQHTVAVGWEGDNFDPDTLTVRQDDTIVFELVGGFHNVVITDDDGEVARSGAAGSGWGSWEFTAEEAGSFTLRCDPHPDMIGNLEVLEAEDDTGLVSFRLDQTPPQTTAALEGEQDGEVYTDEVSLSLAATDAMSGVGETHIRRAGDDGFDDYTGPVSFSDAGTYTIEFRSADVAGNVEDWQAVTFEVADDDPDPDVPQVAVSLDPTAPDGDGGWYTSPVSVTVSSDDDEATLEWRLAGDDDWVVWTDVVTIDDDGSYDLEARASNAAGSSGTEAVAFGLDQAPPETAASVDGEQEGEAYTGDVTVSLDASDATSGVAETHIRQADADGFDVYDGPVTFAGEGSYTVEFRSADLAGNVEDWQSVDFTIAEDVDPIDPVGAPCDRVRGGGSFPDAPGSGHQRFIDCLFELGVVQGYGDGTFGPADDVSRGQLASFVVRAIELATGETMDAGGSLFPDVAPGSTHGQAIYKLRNAGIIRGFEDGTFQPARSVTRDQTARYVVGALELVIGEDLPTTGASFPDVAAGSQYASDIDKLVTAQVVSGFTDGTFGPREPVTRGQMTRFIGNALGVLAEEGAYEGP